MNETKFEIYCNDKTESHHITEKKLKVAINTIIWVWTKSLIIHTVTFRGIVNVEKIYCDFLSCDFFSCDFFSYDFFSYLSCDFWSCDFFSCDFFPFTIYALYLYYLIYWKRCTKIKYRLYWNFMSSHENTNYYLHQWLLVVKSYNVDILFQQICTMSI
jgi:hypothetical protein